MEKTKNLKIRVIALTAALAVMLSVRASAFEKKRLLLPMGSAIGISLKCSGLMVAGFLCVGEGEKARSPAQEAGIRPGDIITRIGEEKLESAAELKAILIEKGMNDAELHITRGKKTLTVFVTPQEGEDNRPELGIWLREGITGIGTVTYIDATTRAFGSLGHSVSDPQTGIILPISGGVVTGVSITSAVRGENGFPGALIGNYDYSSILGKITVNSPEGVFGFFSEIPMFEDNRLMEAADREEVRVGDAIILSTVCGEAPVSYNVKILRIYPEGDDSGRDMLIEICDDRLNGITGGIVQGMSGSPIIQNGRLVGAVTHVLLSEPKKGYAISIEKMLKSADLSR